MKNFSQFIGNPTQSGVGFCCTFSLCLPVPFLICFQHPVGVVSQELVQAQGWGQASPSPQGW